MRYSIKSSIQVFTFILAILISNNIYSDGGYYYDDSIELKDSNVLYLNQWDSLPVDYNVFVVGENHSYPSHNVQIKYNLITYLNKKKGVNNIILEFSYTTGWLLNKFVYENDTSVIEVLNTMPNESYRQLFKALRIYNLDRAPKNKLRIYGVDAEQNSSKIYFAMDYLMKGKPITNADSAIQLDLEVCQMEAAKIYLHTNLYQEPNEDNRGGYSDDVIYCSKNSLEKFHESFTNNPAAFTTYFEKDSVQFLRLMEAIEDYLRARDFDDTKSSYFQAYRERMMIKELVEIHQKDTTQKYFAQFGKCHTASFYAKEYCGSNGFPTFVDRMKVFPQFQVLVTGISYDYFDDMDLYDERYQDFVAAKNNDSIALFNNKNEGKKDGMTHPDYLLIAFEKKSTRGKSNYTSDNFQVHLSYSYGRKFLEKNAFSFQLDPVQNLSFGKNYDYHALSLKVFSEERFFFNLEYNHFVPLQKNYDSGLKANTFSNNYTMDFGADLIINQTVNLTPYAGFAWMNNKVKFSSTQTSNYLLSQNENITISNDAFLLNVGMDFSIKIDAFNIGAKGGYHVDLSNKEWNNAPELYKTNFSGWYAQVFLGFAFE